MKHQMKDEKKKPVALGDDTLDKVNGGTSQIPTMNLEVFPANHQLRTEDAPVFEVRDDLLISKYSGSDDL